MVGVIAVYAGMLFALGLIAMTLLPPKETEKEQADRVREENKQAESRAQYWIPIPDMRVRRHAQAGGYYQ